MDETLAVYSIPLTIALALLSALILSIVIIPVVIRVADMKHLMDEPNERSAHLNKTPTLGGVSIYAATSIAYLFWAACCQVSVLNFILVSMVILFFIGLKDDILLISPYKKMSAQLLTGLIVIIGGDVRLESLYGLFGFYELSYSASIFWTLWIYITVINSFNLIDGIDGLAGGIGVIGSLFFGGWFYFIGKFEYALLAAALAGSLLGFLRYNYSGNKKIFMGDTGSMLVGFTIAVLAIKFIQLNSVPGLVDPEFYVKNAPTVAIAALTIPLFDTLRVFILRIASGRSPFHADRNHLHHLLIDRNLSHFQASLVFYIINVAAILLAILMFRETSTPVSFVYLLFAFVVVLLFTDKGEFIGRNVL